MTSIIALTVLSLPQTIGQNDEDKVLDPVQEIRLAIQADNIPDEDLETIYGIYGGMYMYGREADFRGIDSNDEFSEVMFKLVSIMKYETGKHEGLSDLLNERMHGPLNELSWDDYQEVVEDEFHYVLKAVEAEYNE